ncbi:sugar ABC transporter ATP-binding protein [Cryobacterium glaciale]|uniref:Sugar ABC transporter ATP-binding protein n=1 Tax=Cryobacterium glaciale TaxID=1259145 RepID=A0A4R8UPC5_9MICO|nr:sugar ABC transporter ATP-binding protein [Cryobacterium glaciale]TFB68636.1 sugar ABC transporter ATP-binding protein [Cryobacterium glaciale]
MSDSHTSIAVIEARGLVKRFPGVVALAGMDFELQAGEVHCLVGENGAGKSTLIKILSGFYVPDEGGVYVDGEPMQANTAAAKAAGIATIHQEHNLVPNLSVAENILLGDWGGKSGIVSKQAVRARAKSALDQVAPGIDLNAPAMALSTGEGQMVEIARAIAQDARVVIMDEPTTALADHDVAKLFTLVNDLRARGLAILYVSHKLEEVFELADKITVIRDGQTVASSVPAAQLNTQSVVRLMVGDNVNMYEHVPRQRGEVVLEARGLSRAGAFADVDLQVHAGEIVGLAGLIGAGRTEVARCIYGADRLEKGVVYLDGKKLTLRGARSGINAGIALVPEERKQQGIIPGLSVRENTTLSLLKQVSHWGILKLGIERKLAQKYIGDLSIKTPTAETSIRSLSGGNQQKVIIARCLASNPRVLILDEPTKGIDIGAKAEIHRLIEQLARTGVAVLIISSELPELLALSDRVVVMRRGRIVGELDRAAATKENVMSYAAA